MKFLAYHAAGATPSSSPTDTGGGGGTTSGGGGGLDFANLSGLLINSVVPIAAAILGIGIFILARKKNLSVVLERVGGALAGFAVVAMGVNGLGIDIAGKVLHTIFG